MIGRARAGEQRPPCAVRRSGPASVNGVASQGLHNFVNTINGALVVLGTIGPPLIGGLAAGLVVWRTGRFGRGHLQAQTAPEGTARRV